MGAGIYLDLPNDEYHASEGLSSSDLKVLAKRSFDGFIASKKQRTETNHFAVGRMIHEMILEPDLFKKKYVGYSDEIPKRNTKEGRAVWKEYLDFKKIPSLTIDHTTWEREWFRWKFPGKEYLGREDMFLLTGIKKSLESKPKLVKSLENARKEISIYWEMDGFKCKCRPDALLKTNSIIDLKSSALFVHRASFSSEVYRRKYHWSAAWYCLGVELATGEKVPQFGWVAIEKGYPFEINLIFMPDAVREEATKTVLKVFEKYKIEKEKFDQGLPTSYGDDWKPLEYRKLVEYEHEGIE